MLRYPAHQYLIPLLVGASLALTLPSACSKGLADDPPGGDLGPLHDAPPAELPPQDEGPAAERLPVDAPPVDAPPDHMLPDHMQPDHMQPDHMQPDHMLPDHMLPDHMLPDHMQPDTLPPGVHGAPFTLDFETSGGGFSATRDWEWGKLAFSAGKGCTSSGVKPPPKAHSGTSLWGTVLNDCYNGLDNASSTDDCKNIDPKDDSILSFKVNLPVTWTSATLTYWQWLDAFMNYDWGAVYIDGTSTRKFCSEATPGPPGTNGAWAKVSLDLSSYTGKTITVAFHFVATKVVNQAGWYIDDLSVTGH